MEKYIDEFIIEPLRRILAGELEPSFDLQSDLYRAVDKCERLRAMSLLHLRIQPYYEMYFYADPQMYNYQMRVVKLLVESVIERDDEFRLWIQNQNFDAMADGWSRFMMDSSPNSASPFFALLKRMFDVGFRYDWVQMASEQEQWLLRMEVDGNYKSAEVHAILHALAMIMKSDMSNQDKNRMRELLAEHWDFLKGIYSVMIRTIVGSRVKNFSAVANNVMLSSANYPHLHLFYGILKERAEELCKTKRQVESMTNQMARIEDIVKTTQPSEGLAKLCETLFPDEFREMLDRHRMKKYSELENEVSQLHQEQELLKQEMEKLAKQSEDIANQMAAQLSRAIL